MVVIRRMMIMMMVRSALTLGCCSMIARSSVDDGQCCRVSSIVMLTDRDYHYMRLLL